MEQSRVKQSSSWYECSSDSFQVDSEVISSDLYLLVEVSTARHDDR